MIDSDKYIGLNYEMNRHMKSCLQMGKQQFLKFQSVNTNDGKPHMLINADSFNDVDAFVLFYHDLQFGKEKCFDWLLLQNLIHTRLSIRKLQIHEGNSNFHTKIIVEPSNALLVYNTEASLGLNDILHVYDFSLILLNCILLDNHKCAGFLFSYLAKSLPNLTGDSFLTSDRYKNVLNMFYNLYNISYNSAAEELDCNLYKGSLRENIYADFGAFNTFIRKLNRWRSSRTKYNNYNREIFYEFDNSYRYFPVEILLILKLRLVKNLKTFSHRDFLYGKIFNYQYVMEKLLSEKRYRLIEKSEITDFVNDNIDDLYYSLCANILNSPG
jgi:hypothetical protein